MRPGRARGARRGFTIVELIVALVVTAMVLATAYGSLQVATDATARLRAERRSALAAPAARMALDGWLRGATLAGGGEPFVGVHRARADAPPADEVSFVVLDAGSLYPGPHLVRLFLVQGTDPRRRGLLAELTPVRRGFATVPETLQVSPGATGLAIRYLAPGGTRSEWVGEWRSDRELPAAIEMRAIGTGVEPLLALPLRVPLMEGR